MSKLQIIEGQMTELSREELEQLRAWLAGFDAEAWDRQLRPGNNDMSMARPRGTGR
ncbi:MAG TPA: hypothetical protein VKM93_15590 [Terriglobia bacterium]|nr:hypothetical protein [Terriglobia bacterium]